MILEAVFIFTSIMLIASSLVVILSNHPVIAVLGLIVACVFSAILWLLLEFEFLAVTLILVYVGAVMVLFLFVVMFLDIEVAKKSVGFSKIVPLLITLTSLFFVLLVYPYFIGSFLGVKQSIFENPNPIDYSNVKALGESIFTEAYYQFIIAGIILLVAIVVAISLTLRRRKDNKSIPAYQQINVDKNDRIKIIKDLSP